MKRTEAWRAAVHGVTKSQTQLSNWTPTDPWPGVLTWSYDCQSISSTKYIPLYVITDLLDLTQQRLPSLLFVLLEKNIGCRFSCLQRTVCSRRTLSPCREMTAGGAVAWSPGRDTGGWRGCSGWQLSPEAAEMEGGLESRSWPRCCPELRTCTFSYLSKIQTDLDSSTELILSIYYECFHCVFKY